MSRTVLIVVLISIVVVFAAAHFASNSPDGLEKVAAEKGFSNKALCTPSLFSDYRFPGIKDEPLATTTSAVFGTVLMFGIFLGFVKILKWR